MKKLMIAVAAAAMIGGVEAAQVAKYKASVKYVDMAKKSVLVGNTTRQLYVKHIERTTLRGYVVYHDCACGALSANINPAWLVVVSDAQAKEGGVLLPKIFPADLLVRFVDNKFGAQNMIGAEGYLFAGAGKGSIYQNTAVAPVAPWMFDGAYGFGSASTLTRFLFGAYNDAQRNPDDTLTFWDSWLDHAGFGDAAFDSEEGHCGESTQGYCLNSLKGTLIGGSFLCYPNGAPVYTTQYDFFPCHKWCGTTDVVCGEWQMQKDGSIAPIALVAADGAIYNWMLDNGDDDDDDDDATIVKDALPFLKGACSARAANLSFVKTEIDCNYVTQGIAAVDGYEQPEVAEEEEEGSDE